MQAPVAAEGFIPKGQQKIPRTRLMPVAGTADGPRSGGMVIKQRVLASNRALKILQRQLQRGISVRFRNTRWAFRDLFDHFNPHECQTTR